MLESSWVMFELLLYAQRLSLFAHHSLFVVSSYFVLSFSLFVYLSLVAGPPQYLAVPGPAAPALPQPRTQQAPHPPGAHR